MIDDEKRRKKNASIWFLPGSQVWNLAHPFHKASVWMFSASLSQSGSMSRKHCQLSLKTTEKPKDEEGEEETIRPLTTVSDEQICVDTTTKIKGRRWRLFLFHPQAILPRLHDCLGHRSEGMSFQVCGYNLQQLPPENAQFPKRTAQRLYPIYQELLVDLACRSINHACRSEMDTQDSKETFLFIFLPFPIMRTRQHPRFPTAASSFAVMDAE